MTESSLGPSLVPILNLLAHLSTANNLKNLAEVKIKAAQLWGLSGLQFEKMMPEATA